MTEEELDEFARTLYNTKTFGPPISDTAWLRLQERTPGFYMALVKTAKVLCENG